MTAEEFKNTVIPYSRKLYPMLFRILKSEEETRDALQDLMLKLWAKRKDLAKCTNKGSYIFTVAKNHGFDLLKKKRPTLINEKEEYKLYNLKDDGANGDLLEKYKHVHLAIEKLPEKYKSIIQMRDIDGYSFDEIKDLTGFEKPYLRVILSRARLKVKEQIEKIYSHEIIG